MGIFISILIFGLIIAVHEFGHFICAKLSGIKVLAFSIGMGPKIIKFTKGETTYSLGLLPIGGYCAMEGEDDSSEDRRSFRRQNVWKRMIVLFAGAFMNFVLGFVLVIGMTSMLSSVPTMEIKGFSGVEHEDGTKEYYASSYEAGLRHGDVIVEMDGMKILSTTDLNYVFGQSSVHDVVVKRDGEKILFKNVEFKDNKYGGIVDFGLKYEKKTVGNVIIYSLKDSLSMGRLVFTSLKDLVTGKYGAEAVSGPVGVVTTIDEASQQGENLREKIISLLYLTSLITINIGIFNLLPIPGLDGGRLLFCFIEIIRRKPVKPEHEGYVHLAGMILLFGIMIFATYQDIMRLITGKGI